MKRLPSLVAAGITSALSAMPCLANDSIAEAGAGGLILSRSDIVAMEKEDLFISLDRVTVDYVFGNNSDADVDAIVAFPMPDLNGNLNDMPMLPIRESDNFLGFTVSIDGKPVTPKLEQRAFAVGLDVSEDLRANGVPLFPMHDGTLPALAKLPQNVANDWVSRGLIYIDTYDDGSGWKDERSPLWSLKSTYWWRSTFKASAKTSVSHSYKPSVGATAGLSFFFDDQFQNNYDDYKKRYCLDADFERTIKRLAATAPDGYPELSEFRVQYVLKTGGNWAQGTIKDFKLTVDKGDPRNIVSFCGANVRKTGATTFEMQAKDFYPEHDLDILVLKPFDVTRDADLPKAAKGGTSAKP